jgi:hypothetical protein
VQTSGNAKTRMVWVGEWAWASISTRKPTSASPENLLQLQDKSLAQKFCNFNNLDSSNSTTGLRSILQYYKIFSMNTLSQILLWPLFIPGFQNHVCSVLHLLCRCWKSSYQHSRLYPPHTSANKLHFESSSRAQSFLQVWTLSENWIF